jgi:hypothetical protein
METRKTKVADRWSVEFRRLRRQLNNRPAALANRGFGQRGLTKAPPSTALAAEEEAVDVGAVLAAMGRSSGDGFHGDSGDGGGAAGTAEATARRLAAAVLAPLEPRALSMGEPW